MIIKFPIGDWSDDGHGKCDWFRISTDKTLQDVRDAHFKCEEVLGFEVGKLCEEHEDNIINHTVCELLLKHGIITKDIINVVREHECGDEYAIENVMPNLMIKIWVDTLNNVDETLNLALIEDDEDTINFYGTDEHKRHLNTPGYGCFID
jgi:hypothetical protein